MRRFTVATLAIALLFLPMSSALSQGSHQAFGFHAASIRGFPSGEAFLTGGGAYVLPATIGFLKTGGGFRCVEDVNQGPLTGCKAGEGVRWDAAAILTSFQFKCTGAADETLKTALTDGNTVVMIADFYRHGDGIDESFTARMFVSEVDEAPDLQGVQNVWIQGVGCGDAIANFN
jgi:hypothetical protein